MKPLPHNRRQGFTLVELSIVLVIIGLLIGGILIAQSMIETARVEAFVKQVQQYDVALTNHYTKYNTWPGDDDLYEQASRPDCGSGHLDYLNDGKVEDTCDQNMQFSGDSEMGIYFPELHVMDNLVI